MRRIERHGISLEVDLSDYIGHYLYFGFADEGQSRLFSLCREDSIVLDVGANIGWTACRMARIASKGRVLAFEPDPFNLSRLVMHRGLNTLNNIEAHGVAAGNVAGTARLEVRDSSNRGANRISGSPEAGGRAVEVVRLDDFPPIRALDRIDLIKMDVEGFELRALEGARETILRHRPTLFIEVDDENLRAQGGSARHVIAFLHGVGYRRVEMADSRVSLSGSEDFASCHFDLVASAGSAA